MKFPWFKQVGILFIPSSIIGWLILGCVPILGIYLFVDIDSHSHSVSDTLMSFASNFFIIIVVYTSVAYFSSRSSLK
ncbi:MAG: hypothetical protein HYZ54_08090 [Ignavibacteriae bacterium]|nr:hypothetical protein [Ignavibacteriota bacterium]